MGYLVRRRHRGHRPRARRCAGSTPRRTCSPPSACATACGAGSTPPGSPPPCRRWSTSRASDEGEVSPRMPNDDVAEASPRWSRLWSELEDREHDHGLPLDRRAGRRDGLDGAPLGQRPAAGRGAARTATWPPVTSSAGASRSSTCSARSADAAPQPALARHRPQGGRRRAARRRRRRPARLTGRRRRRPSLSAETERAPAPG